MQKHTSNERNKIVPTKKNIVSNTKQEPATGNYKEPFELDKFIFKMLGLVVVLASIAAFVSAS